MRASIAADLAGSHGRLLTASGTAHTKGSWVELISAANNVHDTHLLFVWCYDTEVSNTDTGMSFDIGIGAAASEIVLIPDILAGFAGVSSGRGNMFPVYIPAGTRIAARNQAVIVSDTVRVLAHLLGESSWGDPDRIRGKWETYGFTAATTRGVTMTSGAANVKGAYAQIVASTTRDHRYLIPSVQAADSSVTAARWFIDIAVGAAASEVIIFPDMFVNASGSEIISGATAMPLLRPIPSGSRIAARIQSSGATDNNSNIVIHAI